LNSLLHVFSAELLTVLSCDNMSNPDISRGSILHFLWSWR